MGETKSQSSKKDLLNAIGSTKFRTEKQVEGIGSLESFVQLIDFSSLTTPNTQIIYDRNDKGKIIFLRLSINIVSLILKKLLSCLLILILKT